MKRPLALLGLIVVVAAGVMIVQHANRDRNYVRLLQAGQQALDVGNSYAAVEAFTGALTLRPDSMVAYYHRGEAYRAQHRDDEAARDFRDAIRRAPDARQPLIALGDLYNLTDPAQAALWYGQAAAQLQFVDPALLYKLALARYRAGSPAEALEPPAPLPATTPWPRPTTCWGSSTAHAAAGRRDWFARPRDSAGARAGRGA